jgi:hypothetical protein
VPDGVFLCCAVWAPKVIASSPPSLLRVEFDRDRFRLAVDSATVTLALSPAARGRRPRLTVTLPNEAALENSPVQSPCCARRELVLIDARADDKPSSEDSPTSWEFSADPKVTQAIDFIDNGGQGGNPIPSYAIELTTVPYSR